MKNIILNPVRLIKYIIGLVKLTRWNNNIDSIKEPHYFLKRAMQLNKHFKGPARRLLISVVKKLRAKYPYEIKDYSKAKQMYENYFKLPNHIPSFEDLLEQNKKDEEVYLVSFRFEVPVKGKRYCEYYINGQSHDENVVLKCMSEYSFSNGKKYITLRSAADTIDRSISEDTMTSYRYATENEILQFKVNQTKVARLRERLQYHQTKKEQIYQEIGDLNKCK